MTTTQDSGAGIERERVAGDLKALSEAATPGKWRHKPFVTGNGDEIWDDRELTIDGIEEFSSSLSPADAEFIVALVNAYRSGLLRASPVVGDEAREREGAPQEGTGYSASPEPAGGLGPAGEYPSRGVELRHFPRRHWSGNMEVVDRQFDYVRCVLPYDYKYTSNSQQWREAALICQALEGPMEALGVMAISPAPTIEAGMAETEGLGAKPESVIAKGEAPESPPSSLRPEEAEASPRQGWVKRANAVVEQGYRFVEYADDDDPIKELWEPLNELGASLDALRQGGGGRDRD